MAENKQAKKKTTRPRVKRRDNLRPIEFLFRQIYDTNSNIVLGYQATVQVNDPKMGVIDYHDLYPVAAKSDLISKLCKWELEEACEFLIRMEKLGKHIHRVFIDMSYKYLSKPKFIEEFEKIISKYNVNKSSFCFEISQVEMQSTSNRFKDNIKYLRENDVKIAMSSYGADNSSITLLAKQSLDYIILDKSFVRDIGDYGVATITESIIEMCEKLNILVIADDVNTKEQLEKIRNMRCFLVLGDYFSKYDREEEIV